MHFNIWQRGFNCVCTERAVLAQVQTEPRVEAACLLAAICGLRLGEIRGLQREDLGDDILTVKHSFSVVDGLKTPKNGRPRVVTLPSFLKERLLELASRNPHNLCLAVDAFGAQR